VAGAHHDNIIRGKHRVQRYYSFSFGVYKRRCSTWNGVNQGIITKPEKE